MGKKRIPWYLRYKRTKRDYAGGHFIPFDKLEEIELQRLQSTSDNPYGGNNQLEERIVSVRIGTTLDKLDELVNETLDKIDGEYVDHRLHNVGLQNVVTIIFNPSGGDSNGR